MKSILSFPIMLFLSAGALVLSCCSTEEALQDMLGVKTEALTFLGCHAPSARELYFEFSREVKLLSIHFDREMEARDSGPGKQLRFTLENAPGAGELVTADILVADEKGNTLNVLVPFRTRNDEIPPLLITEVRTEYSKPKVEYVELRALEKGNLGALALHSALKGGDKPLFVFPPLRVAKGDYIVVHLRNLDGAFKDEREGNPAAVPYSKESEAEEKAWDFWVSGTEKLLSKKGDGLYLQNQDGDILDALLWSEGASPWWQDEKLAQAAEMLHEKGAWKKKDGSIPGPADSVLSRDTTNTRTICRDEEAPDSNGAGDWYVTASSNATPGRKNSTKRFQAPQ